MKVRIFQTDNFTTERFSGNPAAVCPLEHWLETAQMQKIASENNLSETAFFVRTDDGFDLRWFTPTTEVELCGHATLASAWVIFNALGEETGEIRFNTRSGRLTVQRSNGLLTMNLPSRPPEPTTPPEALVDGLGQTPGETLAYGEAGGSGYYLAVFGSEEDIRGLKPDCASLARLSGMIVIVTSPGRTVDFVSRCFAPAFGIDEDPVTGSAHCVLVPYWGKRLGKVRFHAHQVSTRGGELFCELQGDRVSIAGHAVLYLEGTIEV